MRSNTHVNAQKRIFFAKYLPSTLERHKSARFTKTLETLKRCDTRIRAQTKDQDR
jgi:hypothetical protein